MDRLSDSIERLYAWTANHVRLSEDGENRVISWGYKEAEVKASKAKAQIYDDGSLSGKYGVTIWISGRLIMKFQLMYYPACCNMMTFHDFFYDQYLISKDTVYKILDEFLPELGQQSIAWKNRRLIVAMVERVSKAFNLREQRDNLTLESDIPNNLEFPWLYDYFIERGRIANDSRSMNMNTGNIIHLMEVLFPLPPADEEDDEEDDDVEF